MSASKGTDIINNRYGANISRRTVAMHAQQKKIVESSSKRKPVEGILKEHMKTLVDTFQSFFIIK